MYGLSMDMLNTLMGPEIFLYAVAVTLLAGVIKGAVGFAMPLVMISGLSLVLEPKLALAGIILPIVFSNALQVAREGRAQALAAIREFRVYVVMICVMILIASQWVSVIPDRTMYLVLGIPVAALCAVQLVGVAIRIAPQHRRWSEFVVGGLTGTLGGLAGTWGPTTVIYLAAIDTPKKKQIVVQGVVYGLGSVMLLVGHLRSGVFNAQTALFSALMLAPAIVGMWIGFRIQDRVDQATFRKMTLWVALIAGLNLIRRGLL